METIHYKNIDMNTLVEQIQHNKFVIWHDGGKKSLAGWNKADTAEAVEAITFLQEQAHNDHPKIKELKKKSPGRIVNYTEIKPGDVFMERHLMFHCIEGINILQQSMPMKYITGRNLQDGTISEFGNVSGRKELYLLSRVGEY